MDKKINSQVDNSQKLPLSIEEKFVVIKCKSCGAEYMMFAVLRTDKDSEDFYDTPYKIWQQGSWNYCPKCGVHNEMARG